MLFYEEKINDSQIEIHKYSPSIGKIQNIIQNILDIEEDPVDRFIKVHDEVLGNSVKDDQYILDTFNSTLDSFVYSLMSMIERTGPQVETSFSLNDRNRIISNRKASIIGNTLAFEIWASHWGYINFES